MTLTTYNITGQTVAVVVDHDLPAGVHRKEWGRARTAMACGGLRSVSLPLRAGPQVRTGKLALIR